jgi:hypothetical protein
MVVAPEVRLTMEEYEALVQGHMNAHGMNTKKQNRALPRVSKKAKRSGKKDPKMARALRKANAMGRKKSGGFKKGWSQGKIMKKAHQLRRKM